MSNDSFFGSVRSLVGARAVLMALQFLSLPILARLLSLEDFAIIALGMAIPAFANTFSDAGLGRSLIRAQTYDEAEWSTVFWFLLAVGLVLGALVLMSAPLFAWAMGRPELLTVVMVLATVPFMQSVMSVHQASIERAYRFGVISKITVTAGIASVLAALWMAYLGFGYWALVMQQVLLAGFKLLGVFWFSRFRPTMVFRVPLLRRHLVFGRNTLLLSGVLTVQNQLPVLAFNQMFGTLAVSLWSMSERISRFPKLGASGPLSQVTMVSMSRQWQDGDGAASTGKSYLSATRLLATLMFPGLLVVAFNGAPVFAWLLSDTWTGVALIFGLAVPGLLVDMIASLGARVFMVADRTDLRLKMAVERFLIGTAVFLAALPFGVEIAIFVRSLFVVLYLPRYWSFMNQCVPLSVKAEAGVLVPPVLIGLSVGILSAFFITPQLQSDIIGAITVLVLCVFASALAVALTWRGLRKDVTWLRGSPVSAE